MRSWKEFLGLLFKTIEHIFWKCGLILIQMFCLSPISFIVSEHTKIWGTYTIIIHFNILIHKRFKCKCSYHKLSLCFPSANRFILVEVIHLTCSLRIYLKIFNNQDINTFVFILKKKKIYIISVTILAMKIFILKCFLFTLQ